MKVLIIVKSKHNDNTLKIAEAMSEVAPVTIAELCNVDCYNVDEYDIIGLGSGIYFGKHDKELIKFAKTLNRNKAYAFVFSTSGCAKYDKNNSYLKNLLESQNNTVLGTFGCKGCTKWFPLSLFGGINKNRPDFEDFDAAQQFMESIITSYAQLKS